MVPTCRGCAEIMVAMNPLSGHQLGSSANRLGRPEVLPDVVSTGSQPHLP
jgi:hypothetical protein